MMVFNFITLNDDAHLKNFSLINRGDGEYTLAPAYDLINTSLHLSVPRIGLPERTVRKELDFFASEQPLAKELIYRSLLSEDLKRSYYLSYNYRRKMLLD